MEIGNVKPIAGQNMTSSAVQESESRATPLSKLETNNDQKAEEGVEPEENPKAQLEKLNEAVDKLNKTSPIFDSSLQFKIHEATKEVVVSVIDTTTNKVIREIPSEDVLNFVAKMKDYLGMIFDKKA